MARYFVRLSDGKGAFLSEDVKDAVIDGGALVLMDYEKKAAAVFSPGSWVSATKEIDYPDDNVSA